MLKVETELSHMAADFAACGPLTDGEPEPAAFGAPEKAEETPLWVRPLRAKFPKGGKGPQRLRADVTQPQTTP